ncbi:MAG: single-stranded DNA-binding protein [SAR324 cluster bacterium]|nr:single-stranded DNA-binding protein [SAR324 cluster bacterium]
MGSLNRAMLIGRLGRDPELRYTKSGGAVASFSIATDSRWKDKEGNQQERTDWHNIVAWGNLADLAQKYLKKGRLVYIEGRLQTSDWVDNQNVKRYKTEVVANNIQFLERGDAPASAGQGHGPQTGGDAPEPSPGPPPNAQDEAYLEDDIPF